jgi:hypothetical protein
MKKTVLRKKGKFAERRVAFENCPQEYASMGKCSL